MKKLFWVLVMLMMLVSAAQAESLKWDAITGATGYKVYQSVDLGVTWTLVQDVGLVTTYPLTALDQIKLLLFRVSAYSANGETITYWMGAWYDGRKKPIGTPTGTGLQ